VPDGLPPSVMRYKAWRSKKDKKLHLLCREGAEEFNALPTSIRPRCHLPLRRGG
jgi:hypothetical protein